MGVSGTPTGLDLCCGAGGCSEGYSRAGFEMVGVDWRPQPNYPFAFHKGGALAWLEHRLAVGEWPDYQQYDFIHASFPCQDYSRAMRHLAHKQARLIEAGRDLLEQTELPYVMENVPGAPIASQPTLDGRYGIELCGTQFGLRVSRHRLFESNLPLTGPSSSCRCADTAILNPHRAESRERIYAEFGRQDPEILWRDEMGLSWMGRYETREAIPPTYTEFIGHQLMAHLKARVAA